MSKDKKKYVPIRMDPDLVEVLDKMKIDNMSRWVNLSLKALLGLGKCPICGNKLPKINKELNE